MNTDSYERLQCLFFVNVNQTADRKKDSYLEHEFIWTSEFTENQQVILTGVEGEKSQSTELWTRLIGL